MLNQLRPHRIEGEKGFTLIELLVVILIIGILAAVAIPAFLNQRAKAYDAAAKTHVRTAQTAEETYSTDHGGVYASTVNTANATDGLTLLEPTLRNPPYVTGTGTGASSYTLSSTSLGADGDVFTVSVVNGVESRTCTGAGGGCVSSTW